MTTKHTPGPWRFDAENGEILFDDHMGENVQPLIATVNFSNVDQPQGEADGRLITAAPDMLEALRLVEQDTWDENNPNAVKTLRSIARAAIAKAEGSNR